MTRVRFRGTLTYEALTAVQEIPLYEEAKQEAALVVGADDVVKIDSIFLSLIGNSSVDMFFSTSTTQVEAATFHRVSGGITTGDGNFYDQVVFPFPVSGIEAQTARIHAPAVTAGERVSVNITGWIERG